MDRRTTRFAPSPTGFLHLGHVVSALHARFLAGDDGLFLIRIEDIDSTRCTALFTQALLEDLAWLGLRSAAPVRRQSSHDAQYRRVLDGLRQRGLIYPCFCTRAEIARHATARAPDGSLVYPGTCRGRKRTAPAGRAAAWRLDMEKALDTLGFVPSWQEWGKGRREGQAPAFGDVVLARRDTGLAYHLCVTHDDALQHVTCVTRGADLQAATSVHRVLQEIMGWPEPLYAHHPLLTDETGRKLSKSDGAESIRTLRAQGWTAEQVLDHPSLRALWAQIRKDLGQSPHIPGF